MKNPKFRFWFICTALWMCFVFFQSSLSAEVSSSESRGLLEILQHFWPEMTHDLLRKIAHFAEYFVLGGFALGTFFNTKSFKLSKPILFSLLTAVADETLQLYVEGRSSQLLDVWIDLAGATVGALIFWGILTIRKK